MDIIKFVELRLPNHSGHFGMENSFKNPKQWTCHLAEQLLAKSLAETNRTMILLEHGNNWRNVDWLRAKTTCLCPSHSRSSLLEVLNFHFPHLLSRTWSIYKTRTSRKLGQLLYRGGKLQANKNYYDQTWGVIVCSDHNLSITGTVKSTTK